jgi:DNA mismatch endonuclease, patch repair protein
MTDVHTPEQRSRNMAAIRGKDTKPEIIVRTALHALGYRFRLHRKDLPGTPDIVLPKYKTAIFVHGCFWHSHDCRYGRVTPVTRSEFWSEKRAGTVARDQRKNQTLKEQGWQVLTIWECETREPEALSQLFKECLNHPDPPLEMGGVSVKIPRRVSQGSILSNGAERAEP